MSTKSDLTRADESLIFSEPDVVAVLEKSKVIHNFKANDIIFREGDAPTGIFIVDRGLAKVEVTSENGSTHTLRLVGPGGVLGYRSLFASEPYHATAIAAEDAVTSFIPKKDVEDLFNSHPQLAMKLLAHISKDLRLAEAKWLDQMDKGAPERIAAALLYLQDHLANGTWTRREIAAWAGTTPETVIRTLALFEKEGLIDQSDGRHIHIIAKEKLHSRTLGET
jgi:CRP-like cAMP-binding protein